MSTGLWGDSAWNDAAWNGGATAGACDPVPDPTCPRVVRKFHARQCQLVSDVETTYVDEAGYLTVVEVTTWKTTYQIDDPTELTGEELTDADTIALASE